MSSIHRGDFRVYCSSINKREALLACIASLFPFHAMSFYVQRYSPQPTSHADDARRHPLAPFGDHMPSSAQVHLSVSL